MHSDHFAKSKDLLINPKGGNLLEKKWRYNYISDLLYKMLHPLYTNYLSSGDKHCRQKQNRAIVVRQRAKQNFQIATLESLTIVRTRGITCLIKNAQWISHRTDHFKYWLLSELVETWLLIFQNNIYFFSQCWVVGVFIGISDVRESSLSLRNLVMLYNKSNYFCVAYIPVIDDYKKR